MPGSASHANRRKKENALGANTTARQLLWPALVIITVVILDQVTKIWAVNNLIEGRSVEVLGRFFMFTLLYNRGGAMGTMLGSPTYYLISSLIILVFILIYLYTHRDQRSLAVALAAIAGGAIGNIIDRVRIGRVIDFLDVDFFDINLWGFTLQRWWTFNIADAAITVSIVYLLIHALFFSHPHEATDPVEAGATDPVIQQSDDPHSRQTEG